MKVDILQNPKDPEGYLLTASGTLLILSVIDKDGQDDRVNYLVRRIQQQIRTVQAAEELIGKKIDRRELVLRVARLDLFEPYFNNDLDLVGGLEAIVRSFGTQS